MNIKIWHITKYLSKINDNLLEKKFFYDKYSFMINLIWASYYNIWPFKDKLLSVFFEKWKYLIKAPIWTGKSFLFFDWPVYGLYKHTGRNILNIQSKEWFIKLLIEVNWQNLFIVRKISKWKTKESCVSNIYNINNKIDSLSNLTQQSDNTSLLGDIDIEEIIKKDSSIVLEQIEFKNETDLQQNLETFIPPREVFLNTVFLMQDSDNIFELMPSDRLEVLKNVFNLLGIDDAKEKIADKKKEIWYKIKAITDTSIYDQKIKLLLDSYTKNYYNLTNYQLIKDTTSAYKDFFDEIKDLQNQINIKDFGIENFPSNLNKDINDLVDKQKNEYQNLTIQLNSIEEKIKSEDEKIKSDMLEKSKLEQENNNIENLIKNIDIAQIDNLKKEKNIIQQTIENMEKSIKQEKIENWIKDKNITNLQNNKQIIPNAYMLVQELKNQWKILNEETKNIELRIKNIELKLKNDIEIVENNIKNLEKNQDETQDELNNNNQKIKIFEDNINQQATFSCQKIWENCPFIKIINKKTFDQLEEQKSLLIKEEKNIQEKIQKIQKNIQDQKNLKKEYWDIKDNWDIKKYYEDILRLNKSADEIKTFLFDIDRKNIESNYQQFLLLIEKQKELEKIVNNLENEKEKIDQYKLNIEKNKVSIQNIEKNILISQNNMQKSQENKSQINITISNINHWDLINIENTNKTMQENYRDINSLVNDYKNIQIQIKQLKQEEEIINNLYNIFSKELLLLVLQDHLPVLSEIINSYLWQVVDYQINFSLNKTSSDKLELLAQIFDQNWTRDVKSLSWWQRVILKIVWMLAISSYIHSPVLFLDETINNLDTDTVGKVSEMLENFVHLNQIKLFAVTHNQQIQDMKIWDEVIEIKVM